MHVISNFVFLNNILVTTLCIIGKHSETNNFFFMTYRYIFKLFELMDTGRKT